MAADLWGYKLILIASFKINILLNFKLKNEASRAYLNKNKRIVKWRPFWNKVYTTIGVAKILIAKTYYLNLIYLCRKYTIFTKFYEFMLQKVLKFANYAVAVPV